MHCLTWKNDEICLDNQLFYRFSNQSLEEKLLALYQYIDLKYPKFYKMDIVSKIGILASEILLKKIDITQVFKDKTATYLSSNIGSAHVDLKFQDSIKEIASPALFVYTLPNIVLGEICIKNKFKGEQIAFIAPYLDPEELRFHIEDIFHYRGQEHCLCGQINIDKDNIIDTQLYWYNKEDESI
jgi:hypothetical protein